MYAKVKNVRIISMPYIYYLAAAPGKKKHRKYCLATRTFLEDFSSSYVYISYTIIHELKCISFITIDLCTFGGLLVYFDGTRCWWNYVLHAA